MKKPVTLEVHPGNIQCRLYLWPTHMRPDQHPRDLWPNYGHLAKEVGILDSNCLIVGDWASGTEMDEVWAGDGWPHEGMPANWTQVVEHLTAWAKRNGHTIYELSAC